MTFVFLAAAIAKMGDLLAAEPVRGHSSALEDSWSKMAMVAADALVVSLLVGRKWRAGCILAIMVAAGGNMVYAAALVDGRLATLCGCVGGLALTPVEHVALSMVIFGLAGWALAGPHAPARDTAARAAP